MFGNVLCAMGVVGSFWQFQCLQVKGVCLSNLDKPETRVLLLWFIHRLPCLPPSLLRPAVADFNPVSIKLDGRGRSGHSVGFGQLLL
jgi:hypothetical protein